MSRKDYIALADVFAAHADLPGLSDLFVAGYEDARRDLARAVASVLAADNGRFDRARFLEAARVPEPGRRGS